jgi:formylglycine-generating enzyme required for sulfatase activity
MFDMLGNIAEWDASCSGETGGEDGCTIRGGSFFIPVPGYDCSEITSLQRKLRADFVGFRCCRDYVQ